MIIYNTMFYLFAGLLTASAIGVVLSKNPVYSVLLLIFAFFNTAGLFVLIGAEFIAMSLIIVYVGAVAVLFLFVVMMLHVDISTIKELVYHHKVALILVAVSLLVILCLAIGQSNQSVVQLYPLISKESNTLLIGRVLYTTYAPAFIITGLVLFVAMIGAITLTYRKEDRAIKKQNIHHQLSRNKQNGMKILSVKTGVGIKDAK